MNPTPLSFPIVAFLRMTSASTDAELFIGVLAVFGLVSQLDRLRTYFRERRYLSNCRRVLQALTVVDEETELGLRPDSIVGRWMKQARQQAMLRNQISVADMIEEAEMRDDAAFSSQAANVILSVLLIAGLGGTMFSFKNVLGLENPVATSQAIDVSALQKYSNSVVTGMSGAFAASLAGIVSTVFLMITRAVVRMSRDRLFHDLADVTRDELLRMLPRPVVSLTATFADAVDRIDRFTGHLDAVATRLADTGGALQARQTDAVEQLNEFAGKLQGAATGFESIFKEDNVVASSLKSLRASVDSHILALKEEAQERQNASTTELKERRDLEAEERQQRIDEHAAERGERLAVLAEDSRQRQEANQALKGAVELIREGIDSAVQAQRDLKTTVMHLEKAVRQQQDTSGAAAKQWQQLSGTIEQVLRSSNAELVASLGKVEDHVEKITAALKPVQDLPNVLQPVVLAMETIGQNQNAAWQDHKSLSQEATRLHGESMKTLTALQQSFKALDQLPRVLVSLNAALQGLASRQQSQPSVDYQSRWYVRWWRRCFKRRRH